MDKPTFLLCDRCRKTLLHSPEGDTAAKCGQCGCIRDASWEFAKLSLMETHRAAYQRHRYRSGALTEWPPQPGVWA